jgi:hypothetical protein
MKILIEERQLRRIIEELNDECDLFKDTTNRPDYDDVLMGRPNRNMMNIVGEIIEMSPKEYIQRCADMQGTSFDEQMKYIDSIRKEKVINAMGRGVKIDMPMIDYVNKFQEGRHRVMGASELGCDKIKVAVFTKSNNVNSEFNDIPTTIKYNDHDKIKSLFGRDSIDAIYVKRFPLMIELEDGSIYNPATRHPENLKFDEYPNELESFLVDKIRNTDYESLKEKNELSDYEDVNDLMYQIYVFAKDSKYFKTIYEYLIKLFDGVLTNMSREYNDQFTYEIVKPFSVEFKKDHIKINTPENFDMESLYGDKIVNFDFKTKEDFVDEDISVSLVNDYLKKFPYIG